MFQEKINKFIKEYMKFFVQIVFLVLALAGTGVLLIGPCLLAYIYKNGWFFGLYLFTVPLMACFIDWNEYD